jgi:hypothetical protein
MAQQDRTKSRPRYSVKSNQASPLLSLPPELRNRIWQLALGGLNVRGDPIYPRGILRGTP